MRIGEKVASAICYNEGRDICKFRHPILTLSFRNLVIHAEKLVPENQAFWSPNNIPLSGYGINHDTARKSNLNKHVSHVVARINHLFVALWNHIYCADARLTQVFSIILHALLGVMGRAYSWLWSLATGFLRLFAVAFAVGKSSNIEPAETLRAGVARLAGGDTVKDSKG